MHEQAPYVPLSLYSGHDSLTQISHKTRNLQIGVLQMFW